MDSDHADVVRLGQDDEVCWSCGGFVGGSIVEPPTSDDPKAIRRQVERLRRLVEDVAAGRLAVEELANRIDRACPLCVSTMEHISPQATREDAIGRLRYQIELLGERADNLERRLNASP